MNNLDIETITGIPVGKSIYKDLGTEFNLNDSAEMYSNSNKKEKKNKNKNTFQQSTGPSDPTYVNVRGQAPTSFPSPSAPSVKENQEIPDTEKPYGRRLNWREDKIVQIHIQMGIPKQGTRYTRVPAYLSIRTETDTRYMIFMRSSLTTANDETMRGIVKENDKPLQSVLEDVISEHGMNNVFTGRVKYKLVKGQKIKDFHRKNLPQSLLSIYAGDDGCLHAQFYLLGEYYDIRMDEELSQKQTKIYKAQGSWELDEGTMSLDEAFGG